jgi:hypothetical protein
MSKRPIRDGGRNKHPIRDRLPGSLRCRFVLPPAKKLHRLRLLLDGGLKENKKKTKENCRYEFEA